MQISCVDKTAIAPTDGKATKAEKKTGLLLQRPRQPEQTGREGEAWEFLRCPVDLSHLPLVDVFHCRQMQDEIVIREGGLGVGKTAVVACKKEQRKPPSGSADRFRGGEGRERRSRGHVIRFAVLTATLEDVEPGAFAVQEIPSL